MDDVISILISLVIALAGIQSIPVAFKFYAERKIISAVATVAWSGFLFYIALRVSGLL
jgi:hypothetical protein